MHACSNRNVRPCILRAAIHRRQSYADLLRVATCESTLNAWASNGSHHGIYQFAPSTWATTPYTLRSLWSAKWSALAAAWMWSVGRRGEWSCR